MGLTLGQRGSQIIFFPIPLNFVVQKCGLVFVRSELSIVFCVYIK